MATARTRQRTQPPYEASEEEEPRQRKRKRVSQACEECRRRKDRCDGRQPVCQPCTEEGRECVYNFKKKRGLPTGYVRALELVLGLVFRSIEGSDQFVAGLLQGQAPAPRISYSSPNTFQGSSPVAALLESWRQSAVLKELEKVLLAGQTEGEETSGDTLDAKFEEAISAIPPTQGATASSPAPPSPPATNYPIRVSVPDAPPVQQQTSRPAPTQEPLAPAKSKDNAAILPPNWFHLLDMYFTNTHCWFPIVQRHECLRTAHLLANQTTAGSKDPITRGERKLLWAMLAQAAQSCQSPAMSLDDDQEGQICNRLRDEAESLITNDQPERDLDDVRAFLILALLHIGCRSWAKAWLYVGQAVYLAVDLGHIARRAGLSHGMYDDDRSRTVLGCFVLETLIAARLNRRPYLRRSDICLTALEPNGIEEWEPWQPHRGLTVASLGLHSPGHVSSTFNQFAVLVCVLNDMITESPEELPGYPTPQVTKSIEGWAEQLPTQCQAIFRGAPSKVAISPQMLNFSLAFGSIIFSLKSRNALATHDPFYDSQLEQKMDQASRVAARQIDILGPEHLPAISETYLSLFEQRFSVRNRLLNDNVSYSCNICDKLRSGLERRWQSGKSSTCRTEHASRSEPPLSHVPVTAPQNNTVFDAHNTAQPNVSAATATSQQVDSDHSRNTAQEASMVGSHSRLDAGEGNDDSLFEALTLLDPVDWYGSPSRNHSITNAAVQVCKSARVHAKFGADV